MGRQLRWPSMGRLFNHPFDYREDSAARLVVSHLTKGLQAKQALFGSCESYVPRRDFIDLDDSGKILKVRRSLPRINFPSLSPDTRKWPIGVTAAPMRVILRSAFPSWVRAAPPAAAAAPSGALRRIVVSVKRCDLQIQGSGS